MPGKVLHYGRLAIIRLDCKGLIAANTIAYFDAKKIIFFNIDPRSRGPSGFGVTSTSVAS